MTLLHSTWCSTSPCCSYYSECYLRKSYLHFSKLIAGLCCTDDRQWLSRDFGIKHKAMPAFFFVIFGFSSHLGALWKLIVAFCEAVLPVTANQPWQSFQISSEFLWDYQNYWAHFIILYTASNYSELLAYRWKCHGFFHLLFRCSHH